MLTLSDEFLRSKLFKIFGKSRRKKFIGYFFFFYVRFERIMRGSAHCSDQIFFTLAMNKKYCLFNFGQIVIESNKKF